MSEKIKNYAKKHKKELKTAAIVLTLGIIYYIIIQLTEFRLICIFRKITGLACPGCGITHQINHLLHFRFKDAMSENLATTVLLPIYFAVYAVRFLFKPKCLQNNGRLFNTIVFITIAFLIIFGALRNIKGFEFLLPSYMR